MELRQRRVMASPFGAAEEEEEGQEAPPDISDALKAAEQAQNSEKAKQTKRSEAAKKGWETRRNQEQDRMMNPDRYGRICICGNEFCYAGPFRWIRKSGTKAT